MRLPFEYIVVLYGENWHGGIGIGTAIPIDILDKDARCETTINL